MAIKPVTYQGVGNFDAHLYALEVASRFIDQSRAHGFYKNYGEELAASVYDNNIIVGTGAFLVCGRMNEITARETVPVAITNGYVGYIVARVETYHPSDQNNCRLLAYTAASLADINLTQNDIYTLESKSDNKVYELPLFSFEIRNGSITNVKRLLSAVADYATVKSIVDQALSTAENAVNSATAANTKSDAAVTTSNDAKQKAEAAVVTANSAAQTAGNANAKSDAAVTTSNAAAQEVKDYSAATDASIANYKSAIETSIDQKHAEMTAEINDLSAQIGDKQGSTVKVNGVAVAEYDTKDVINSGDTVLLSGGTV